MYSTCTFCHAALGANEAIEAFPVGRRLAFDAAKGRLWVVCGACKQWNLSPLDERLEVIEAAERLYRDTKLRVATDQVGLARLRDGTELIRIGSPLRPEFAAWRYGDRFTLRQRKYMIGTTLMGVGVTAAIGLGWVAGLGITALPFNLYQIGSTYFGRRRIVGKFADANGPISVTRWQAATMRIVPEDEVHGAWKLTLAHSRSDLDVGRLGPSTLGAEPRATFRGAEAIEVARRLLPTINSSGAKRAVVQDAVAVLEATKGIDDAFLCAASTLGRDTFGDPSRDLAALPAELRLALEMATHEDLERRALEGELRQLEDAWKEAEEIAAIADSLTLPQWMLERIEKLGRG